VIRALIITVLLLTAGGMAVRLGFGQVLGQGPANATGAETRAPGVSSGEVSIDMTEAALSDAVNTNLSGRTLGPTPFGSASLKRIGIRLQPDRVQADGDATIGATTVPVSLAGTVSVQAGAPVVSLNDATAAGLPLPDTARSLVERALQSNLQDLVAQQRIRLSAVIVTTGKLTIVGSRY
jgi:hypothetical protein